MRIFGTGQISDAKQKDETRRAQEARKARSEALLKEAEKAAEKPDADVTVKAAAKRGASALKLAYAVNQTDPGKLAQAMGEAPQELLGAAVSQPGKFTDTTLKGAAIAVGGVVGSEAFRLTRGALSARKKLLDIREVTDKIAQVGQKAQGDLSLAEATGKGLEKLAKLEAKLPKAKDLDKLGRVNAGMSVATGLNDALHLRHSIAALKDGATLKELADLAGDVLGTVRGADDATKLIRGKTLGFLGGKINPAVSLAADAAGVAKTVSTLKTDWHQLSTKDKVANFVSLGGDLTDAVGSGLIMTGAAAPVGVALKTVGAGLGLVSLGIDNAATVTRGAKKVWAAVNPFD